MGDMIFLKPIHTIEFLQSGDMTWENRDMLNFIFSIAYIGILCLFIVLFFVVFLLYQEWIHP